VPLSASPPGVFRFPRLTICRYDFDYEGSDDDESGDIGIENKYYNAKQMKADNPEEAVVEFLGLPPMEQDKSEWCVVGYRGI